MQLRVFDYDSNSANDLLGFNVIPLALIKSGVTDLWLKIQPEKNLEKLSEEMMEVRVRTVSHLPVCRCNLASDRQSPCSSQSGSSRASSTQCCTLNLLLECGRSKLWCELVQNCIGGHAGNGRVARGFYERSVGLCRPERDHIKVMACCMSSSPTPSALTGNPFCSTKPATQCQLASPPEHAVMCVFLCSGTVL